MHHAITTPSAPQGSSRTSTTTLYLPAHLAIQILDVCLSRPSTSPSTSHALASKKLTQSILPIFNISMKNSRPAWCQQHTFFLVPYQEQHPGLLFQLLFTNKDDPSSVWRHVHELFIQDVCRGMLHLIVAKSCQLIHNIPITSTCRH